MKFNASIKNSGPPHFSNAASTYLLKANRTMSYPSGQRWPWNFFSYSE